jgi:hypothetical protein
MSTLFLSHIGGGGGGGGTKQSLDVDQSNLVSECRGTSVTAQRLTTECTKGKKGEGEEPIGVTADDVVLCTAMMLCHNTAQRCQVFWDVMMCKWVSGSHCFQVM